MARPLTVQWVKDRLAWHLQVVQTEASVLVGRIVDIVEDGVNVERVSVQRGIVHETPLAVQPSSTKAI